MLYKFKKIIFFLLALNLSINFDINAGKHELLKLIKSSKTKSFIIEHNYKNLNQAIKLHAQKPGFENLIISIDRLVKRNNIKPKKGRDNFLKGLVYEVTESANLNTKYLDDLEFQVVAYCALKNIKRVFDIVNPNYKIVWELKNICWEFTEYRPELIAKLQNQLLDEKYLAEKFGHKLILHSNQKITPFWKNWLEEEDIQFKDNTQSYDNNDDNLD